MLYRQSLAAVLLAAVGCVNVQAASLAVNAGWSEFSVAEELTGNLNWADFDGAPLSFDFSIGAGQQGVLTVVDTGFAGDMFSLLNGVTSFGSTSAVPVRTLGSESAVVDFDLALADLSFSRATITLGAGSYSISGLLTQSVLDESAIAPFALAPLNSTAGGIRLDVSPVPEPSSLALMAGGLALLAARARRRTR